MDEEIFGPVLTIYVYDDEAYAQTLDLCDSSSIYALTGLEHSAGNFYINEKPEPNESGVTVSIPWIGEKTSAFLQRLYTALKQGGDRWGPWLFYLDQNHQDSLQFRRLFETLPWCRVEEPGERYRNSLLNSKYAVIYGGYNSIMDVLSTSIPALVILRDMEDREQQEHLDKLLHATDGSLIPLPEDCREEELRNALQHLTSQKKQFNATINLDGAENAAKYILELVNTKPT